nr:2Fe-2S iron-sulfur cluster-binding protein [Thalassotalea sp. Y01]
MFLTSLAQGNYLYWGKVSDKDQLMGQVTYIEPCGTVHEVNVENGKSLLDAAFDNEIYAMPGVCGGDAACATCHCVVEQEWFDKLDEMSEDEYYMLQSQAEEEVTATSRLACQIKMRDELDGIILMIAAGN